MKISEYPLTEEVKDNDVLLMDGPRGTKTIPANSFLEKKNVSSLLNPTVSGKLISVADVSPYEHSVQCKVSNVSFSDTIKVYKTEHYIAGGTYDPVNAALVGSDIDEIRVEDYISLKGITQVEIRLRTGGKLPYTSRIIFYKDDYSLAPDFSWGITTRTISLGSSYSFMRFSFPRVNIEDLVLVLKGRPEGDIFIKFSDVYSVNRSGEVVGITSTSPYMSLIPSNTNAVLTVTYNRDPGLALEDATKRIDELMLINYDLNERVEANTAQNAYTAMMTGTEMGA